MALTLTINGASVRTILAVNPVGKSECVTTWKVTGATPGLQVVLAQDVNGVVYTWASGVANSAGDWSGSFGFASASPPAEGDFFAIQFGPGAQHQIVSNAVLGIPLPAGYPCDF